MKWWGWGEEDVFFTHEGKPELAPFIERVLGLDVRRPGTSAIAKSVLTTLCTESTSGVAMPASSMYAVR